LLHIDIMEFGLYSLHSTLTARYLDFVCRNFSTWIPEAFFLQSTWHSLFDFYAPWWPAG